MRDLEKQIHEALVNLDRIAWLKLGYNASRFRQMLFEHGALKTVRMLLGNSVVQYGFTKLWELNRLDLTVEALILKSPWDKLFSDDEKAIARQRLMEYGYKPD